MQEIAKFKVKLVKKEPLTSDVLALTFTKPAGLAYQAGQFMQWAVADGDKIILRPYSLSSAPADETIEFCVKVLPEGKASALALTLTVGDEMELAGPRGVFVSRQTDSSLYLVATGVGLAPIMGIIKDELANKKTEAEVRLLFGVRSEADIFWQNRLAALKSGYENFSYQITLSQPKTGGGWSGLRGRVTDHILHHLVHHEFFLCGNAAMVKDVRQILLENGVAAGQIHFEIF